MNISQFVDHIVATAVATSSYSVSGTLVAKAATPTATAAIHTIDAEPAHIVAN